MFIPETATLSPWILFGRKHKYNLWNVNSIFNSDSTLYFRYGRDAIRYSLHLLNISPENNILIPAYTCEAVIQPLLSAGINIKFYNVNRNLQYDINEIEAKIDKRTQAIYTIHFFGFPCEIHELKRLCHNKGIFLIEDCAHSLLGKLGEEKLGSFGHVGIFSLRKFFPIPDGGVLQVNDSGLMKNRNLPISRKTTTIQNLLATYKLLQKHFNLKTGISLNLAKKVWAGLNLAHTDPVDRLDAYITDYEACEMSALSISIIQSIDAIEMIQKRRENYCFWQNEIQAINSLTPIYESPVDTLCPYSFPVLAEYRDKLLSKAKRKGIFLEPTFKNSPFTELPNLIKRDEKFEDTKFVADRILSLPVHQSLNISILCKILQELKKL